MCRNWLYFKKKLKFPHNVNSIWVMATVTKVSDVALAPLVLVFAMLYYWICYFIYANIKLVTTMYKLCLK